MPGTADLVTFQKTARLIKFQRTTSIDADPIIETLIPSSSLGKAQEKILRESNPQSLCDSSKISTSLQDGFASKEPTAGNPFWNIFP